MKRILKTTGMAAIGAVALQMGAMNAAIAQDLTPVEVLLPIPEGFAFTPLIVARELGYFALDEGDYNALPAHLAARVVHTVHGAMLDEF